MIPRRYPVPGKRRYRLPWAPSAGASGAWQTAPSALSPGVAVPTVMVFEDLPVVANGEQIPVFGLNWGFHQSRIVTMTDGTVWVAICNTSSFNATPSLDAVQAQVLKRTPAGVWSVEHSVRIGDDFHLLGDHANGLVHLCCVTGTSSADAQVAVITFPGALVSYPPGAWGSHWRPSSSRYMAAGIGGDGLIVIKTSTDGGGGSEPTEACFTNVSHGMWTGSQLEWTARNSVSTGIRKGYDTLVVGASGQRNRVIGIGAHNPHAEDYVPFHASLSGYVFAGADQYYWDAESPSGMTRTNTMAPPTYTGTGQFLARKYDVLLDTVGSRVFMTYLVAGASGKSSGWWLMVTDLTNAALADVHLSAAGKIPTTGTNVSIVQSGNGKFWLIVDQSQSFAATTAPNSRVYVAELVEGPANSFTVPDLASMTNIGTSLGDYWTDAIYVSKVHGGGALLSNYIDCLVCGGETHLPHGGVADLYPSDTTYGRNLMRLALARIQLY